MPQNQFLPWAAGAGANTLTPSAYALIGELAQGFQAGQASSQKANTLFRQMSTVASAFGQFLADNQSSDVLDDGFPAHLESQFYAALSNYIGTGVQSGKWVFGTAAGTNTYTATLTPANTTFTPGMEILLYFTNPNTNTSPTLSVDGTTALPILKQGAGAPAVGDISRFVPLILDNSGTHWIINSLVTSDIVVTVAPLIRARLSANMTIYINSSTGNDANPGTSALPFRTLAAAVAYAQLNLDLNGYVLTFSGTGTFAAGVTVNQFIGQINPASVAFALGTSTITSAGACFIANPGAAFTISSSGALSSTGSGFGAGYGIIINGGAQVNYSGVTFGACTTAHVQVGNGGVAGIMGAYTISGGATKHFDAEPFGEIEVFAASLITFSGTPTFSTAFAYTNQGTINLANVTFSGTFVGTKYYIDGFGSIFTTTALASFFPGTIAGVDTKLLTLGFLSTQATNGSVTIPTANGNVIINWGAYTGGAQDPTINFATAYTAIPHMACTPTVSGTSTTLYVIQLSTISTAGFVGQQRFVSGAGGAASSPVSFSWIAIGY